MDACTRTKSITCGVYSNLNEWISIFGSTTYSYGSQLPIWYFLQLLHLLLSSYLLTIFIFTYYHDNNRYSHHNNQTNFLDFVSFGGWNFAYAKQYLSGTSLCGYYSASLSSNPNPNLACFPVCLFYATFPCDGTRVDLNRDWAPVYSG